MLLYQGFIRPSYDYPGIQVINLIRHKKSKEYIDRLDKESTKLKAEIYVEKLDLDWAR